MKLKSPDWLSKKYPQNFIIRKPVKGALWSFLITFGFMMLYRPLDPNDKKVLGYEGAMAAYCLLASFTLCIVVILLKKTAWFSKSDTWSLLKELLVILICLPLMSMVIFISGILIENGFPNIYDSFKDTSLIGIIPFVIFSIPNLYYLMPENEEYKENNRDESVVEKKSEEKINIISKLKNENLSFYPKQFLYAESNGNYVVFYLNVDNKIRKETIRNAISDIEDQLSHIPFFFRVHRAFIVNLTKVAKKSGNTLGYRIKLYGIENEIPVSRQNTKDFNKQVNQIHKNS